MPPFVCYYLLYTLILKIFGRQYVSSLNTDCRNYFSFTVCSPIKGYQYIVKNYQNQLMFVIVIANQKWHIFTEWPKKVATSDR